MRTNSSVAKAALSIGKRKGSTPRHIATISKRDPDRLSARSPLPLIIYPGNLAITLSTIPNPFMRINP